MNPKHRTLFDRWLEELLDDLPPRLRELVEETPIIVEDRPDPKLLRQLGLNPEDGEDLCGLHTGIALTERSVEHGFALPETVHLFREGIIEEAGGWLPWREDDGTWIGGEKKIREQIRITLLHEIGHHFGLEEDDLEGLGYG